GHIFDADARSKEARPASHQDRQFAHVRLTQAVIKAQMFLVLNSYQAALDMTRIVRETEDFYPLEIMLTQGYYIEALAGAGLIPEGSEAEQNEHWLAFEKNLECFKNWAALCPENFAHKLRLLKAEQARAQGRFPEAFELYHQAVELAEQNCFYLDLALALELAGRFYLDRGLKSSARIFLIEAYGRYRDWGGERKLEIMEETYRDLFSIGPAAFGEYSGRMFSTAPVPLPEDASWLSLQSVIEKLSREKNEKRLSEYFFCFAAGWAGAEHGILLIKEAGEYLAVARYRVGGDQAWIDPPASFDQTPDLCADLVRLSLRVQHEIRLDDASGEGDFKTHPNIVNRQVRSIWSLPLILQGESVGVLYLENNHRAGVFLEKRGPVLRSLCALAAAWNEVFRLQRALSSNSGELEKNRAALKVLTENLNKEKAAWEEKQAVALNQTVRPFMEKLRKNGLSAGQTVLVDIIEQKLEKLAQVEAPSLVSAVLGLSAMELKVAELIKLGKTSGEIAEILNISTSTVSFHRANLRHKLGITTRKTSLRQKLLSLNAS
ncbi:MAG: GAF domain-containing protein, partial [Deltaproteobacteria bacterium]|nr:GAF domain-containing protein [Deltaproteobacteria bacterium]